MNEKTFSIDCYSNDISMIVIVKANQKLIHLDHQDHLILQDHLMVIIILLI